MDYNTAITIKQTVDTIIDAAKNGTTINNNTQQSLQPLTDETITSAYGYLDIYNNVQYHVEERVYRDYPNNIDENKIHQVTMDITNSIYNYGDHHSEMQCMADDAVDEAFA